MFKLFLFTLSVRFGAKRLVKTLSLNSVSTVIIITSYKTVSKKQLLGALHVCSMFAVSAELSVYTYRLAIRSLLRV